MNEASGSTRSGGFAAPSKLEQEARSRRRNGVPSPTSASLRETQSMDTAASRTRKRWLIGTTVFVLASLAGILWLGWEAIQPHPIGRYRLPDGTILTIRGVTCADESPPDWRGNLQTLFLRRRSRSPTTGAGGLRIYWDDVGEENSFTVTVSDDYGHYASSAGGGFGGDDLGHPLNYWDLVAFPRRASSLRGQVFLDQDGKWLQVADFQFQNPDPGPHPHWSPLPLPQARSSGGVTVTLRELRALQPPPPDPGDPSQRPPLPETWTRVALEIHDPHHPSTAWKVQEIEITDATGNQFGDDSPGQEWKRGRLLVDTETSHGVTDDVWKVVMKLKKPRTSDLDASELWKLSVPVPAVNATRRLGARRKLGVIQAEAVSVLGPNASLPPQFQQGGYEPSSLPQIFLRFSGLQDLPPDVLQHNSRGGTSELGANDIRDGATDEALYRVRPQAGRSTVDLELIARQTVTVEFLAARQPLNAK